MLPRVFCAQARARRPGSGARYLDGPAGFTVHSAILKESLFTTHGAGGGHKSSYENVIILTESSQSLIASMCIGDVFLILSFVSLLASCSSAANNPGCVCGVR